MTHAGEDTAGDERMGAMLSTYREMHRQLVETTASVRATRVTAESPDGLARATVGGGGELLDLWIRPEVYARVDAPTLAKTIKSTIVEARRQSTEQAAAQYRSVLGSSFDVNALLGGDPAAAAAQIRRTSRRLFSTGNGRQP